MSIFTILASGLEDEDAEWMRGCKILDVTFSEGGVTFLLGSNDDE